MLGYFLLTDPDIYDTVLDIIDQYRSVVNSYNNSVGLKDIAARLLRPDDQIIGGTAETYQDTYTDATDEYLLPASSSVPTRVPTGQGVVHLGWRCEADLGGDGVLQVDLEGIKRQEINARWAYDMPFSLYIEPQQIVFARENDRIAWIIHAAAGLDITSVIYPFAFLIGPRKQLLV